MTTSDTSINLTRSDVEGDAQGGECDQYVWSVTAVNPAGISWPANYTFPVYFPSGINSSSIITLQCAYARQGYAFVRVSLCTYI